MLRAAVHAHLYAYRIYVSEGYSPPPRERSRPALSFPTSTVGINFFSSRVRPSTSTLSSPKKSHTPNHSLHRRALLYYRMVTVKIMYSHSVRSRACVWCVSRDNCTDPAPVSTAKQKSTTSTSILRTRAHPSRFTHGNRLSRVTRRKARAWVL